MKNDTNNQDTPTRQDGSKVGCSNLLARISLLEGVIERAEELLCETVDCMTDEKIRKQVNLWYKDKNDYVGDNRREFRLILEGEVFEEGDEVLQDDSVNWRAFDKPEDNLWLGKPREAWMLPCRRPI